MLDVSCFSPRDVIITKTMWRLKFWQFFSLSTVFSAVVIANAFNLRKGEFYPSVVYMTKSAVSLTVLSIQALAMIWAFFKCCQKLLFGPLRALEVEHVLEKSWYAVTESALAFTVFRDEFNVPFVTSFIFLLAVKCAHWISEDRADLLERSPSLPNIFHIRMIGVMFLLIFIDASCVQYSLSYVVSRGPTVHLVFAFEYAVLYAVLFMVAAKYTLHSMDQRRHFGWDRKVVYLLYAELATSFFRIVLYTGFISLLLSMKIFALFAIRPAFMAVRSFSKALTDVIRSRIAIRNLNTLFADATAADLTTLSDPLCIICREEMAVEGDHTQTCKKLECGHIFHAGCLRSWFQRQQSCPTCRADVVSMRNGSRARSASAARNRPQQAQAALSRFAPVPPSFFMPQPIQFFSPSLQFQSQSNSNTTNLAQLKAREAALVADLEARMKCLESARQCLNASVGQLKTYVDLAKAQSQTNENR